MPEIKPFRGIIYNKNLPIEKVVAPPYDVISEKERDELYDLHEFNVIRLILNRDADRYERAKKIFDDWLKNNVLVEQNEEAIYIYEQKFEIDGELYERIGIICLMKLEEFGKGDIFPHEKTFPKPKEDRFNLLKSTNAQFDHIFGIYSDPQFKLEKLIDEFKPSLPLFNFEFPSGGKVWHYLYEIKNAKFFEKVGEIFENLQIFIADGHHRYETGLMFRDYIASLHKGDYPSSYDYILTYLTNMEAEGLVILPTHRIISNVDKVELKHKFNSEKISAQFEIIKTNSSQDFKKHFPIKNFQKGVFGVCLDRDDFLILKMKNKDMINLVLSNDLPEPVKSLDVTILHEFIFNLLGLNTSEIKLSYTHNLDEALKLSEEVDKVAFILNPPSINDVRSVSLSGATMPQKSTYFYPKLLSGIVMRRF
jgi:uncharacterized protein (DUF1015 family)